MLVVLLGLQLLLAAQQVAGIAESLAVSLVQVAETKNQPLSMFLMVFHMVQADAESGLLGAARVLVT